MPATTDIPPPAIKDVDAEASRPSDDVPEKQLEPFVKFNGTVKNMSNVPASKAKLKALSVNEASTLPEQDPSSTVVKNVNGAKKYCGKVEQKEEKVIHQNGSIESTGVEDDKETEEYEKVENSSAGSADSENKDITIKDEKGVVSDVEISEIRRENEAKKRKSPKKNKEPSLQKRNTKKPVKSHLLTEFYPVRRSSRRPKSVLEKEEEDSVFNAIKTKCEDDLGVVEFDGKGRGVVAKRAFKKGCFIVEYAGDLIDWTEAKKREEEYSKDPSVGCYMYYFVFDNVNYCVDATAESGRLGRLLNHSRKNPNCKTKLVSMPNPKGAGTTPRLIIIANRDIKSGEELTYDYGDRDRETLQSHPWLKCT